jgi:hypothetical protein
MKKKMSSNIMRFFTAIVIAALFAAFVPQAGFAASYPSLSFTEIKSGVSVTVHGENFPKNVDFNARMDVIGNYAIGGTVVGSFNSGSGSFDKTFNIPASLKNEKYIAIRVDGVGGWYSYNWFTNNTSGVVSTPTPTTPSTTQKNYVEVIGVKANDYIVVQANNFPANQNFKIRIGTFKNFSKDYVVAGNVNSGKGGSFQFSVDLPTMQKDVDLFTIRLDSPEKNYAYNVFKNITSGVSTPTTGTTTPIPTSGTCQIISISPSTALSTRADFDAVWNVKNTSGKNWELTQVDYKFISGSQLQKYEKLYDLPVTVKPGETIKIRVDMLAPTTTGIYATNWAIVQGKTTLCTLPLTVRVK